MGGGRNDVRHSPQPLQRVQRRVRRASRIFSGRRDSAHRLEGAGKIRPLFHQRIRRRDQSASLSSARYQRLHGLRFRWHHQIRLRLHPRRFARLSYPAPAGCRRSGDLFRPHRKHYPAAGQARLPDPDSSCPRKPRPGGETNVGRILEEIAGQIKRRGMVVLVSDLLDEPEQILKGFRLFRFKGNDVIVFHLLDPAELSLPFEGNILFEDLEGAESQSRGGSARDPQNLSGSRRRVYRAGCARSATIAPSTISSSRPRPH